VKNGGNDQKSGGTNFSAIQEPNATRQQQSSASEMSTRQSARQQMRWVWSLLSLVMIQSLEERTCGINEILVQDASHPILSNGCSKPSFIKVEGEEDFTYCCDRHDACYACCGAPKAYCDDDFQKCMIKLCETNFNSSPGCKSAASTYALGTKVFGQTGYLESQYDYCQCEKVDTIDEYYSNIVDQFYRQYVPEKLIDIPKTLSNYVTSSSGKRYHQLYYDLHKKYDHAIGHIEGRKQKKEIPRPPRKVKEL
jgi:hypothetical protein